MKNKNSLKNYNVQMRITGSRIKQYIRKKLFTTDPLLYFKYNSLSLTILKNK